MARKEIVELLDDIDQSPALRTVTFSLDGTTYEIDLSEDNIIKLEGALGPFIAKARKVSGGRRVTRSRQNGTGDAAAIRAWAVEHGYEVSSRGRVSAEIREAYQASQ